MNDKQRLLDRTRVTNTVAEERRKQLVETNEVLDEIFAEYRNMRVDAVEEDEVIFKIQLRCSAIAGLERNNPTILFSCRSV